MQTLIFFTFKAFSIRHLPILFFIPKTIKKVNIVYENTDMSIV